MTITVLNSFFLSFSRYLFQILLVYLFLSSKITLYYVRPNHVMQLNRCRRFKFKPTNWWLWLKHCEKYTLHSGKRRSSAPRPRWARSSGRRSSRRSRRITTRLNKFNLTSSKKKTLLVPPVINKHYWKCNFPMSSSVRRSVFWTVCHNILKWREVSPTPCLLKKNLDVFC